MSETPPFLGRYLSFAARVALLVSACAGVLFVYDPSIARDLLQASLLVSGILLWLVYYRNPVDAESIGRLWGRAAPVITSPWSSTVVIAAYACLFAVIKVNQHLSLNTGASDLSIYDYAIFNTLHGEFMYSPFVDVEGRNILSEHFSPFLLLFVPGYAVFGSPIFLLAAQGVVVAVAAAPLAAFARIVTRRPEAPLLF